MNDADRMADRKCAFRVYPKSTVLQTYVSHRLASRAVGHARDIAAKFVLLMAPFLQCWPSRWRHRNNHTIQGISVIDAVTTWRFARPLPVSLPRSDQRSSDRGDRSFNGRMRDECLNEHLVPTLAAIVASQTGPIGQGARRRNGQSAEPHAAMCMRRGAMFCR